MRFSGNVDSILNKDATGVPNTHLRVKNILYPVLGKKQLVFWILATLRNNQLAFVELPLVNNKKSELTFGASFVILWRMMESNPKGWLHAKHDLIGDYARPNPVTSFSSDHLALFQHEHSFFGWATIPPPTTLRALVYCVTRISYAAPSSQFLSL